MATRAADSDSELYDFEEASRLRRRGWQVTDPYTLAGLNRKACAGRLCLTLVPDGRELCHYCERSA